MTETVPEGFTVESYYTNKDEATVVTSPQKFFVTIHWRDRGFRNGTTTIGRLESKKTYRGRGWRQQLVNDAVAHLQAIDNTVLKDRKKNR